MSNDFSAYPILIQLINSFGLPNKPSPENFLDFLMIQDNKMISSTTERRQIVEALSQKCENPSNFFQIYESLQSKDVQILDDILKLLMLITNNKKVMNFLANARNIRTQKLINLASLEHSFKYRNFAMKKTSESTPDKRKSVASSTGRPSVHSKPPAIPMRKSFRNLYETRPNLNSYDVISGTSPLDTIFLSTLSPRDQELLACEDMLFVLMGINGRFITFDPKGSTFLIDNNFSQRIHGALSKIIPLPIAYSSIVKFIEGMSVNTHSLVGHALSNAVFQIQKEYLSLISDLEIMFRNGELSLLKLMFYKESCITQMEFVASICRSIHKDGNDTKSILNVLNNRLEISMNSGVCLSICEFLMHSAIVPYFEMIEKWIYSGTIFDPYDEFIIQVNENELKNIECPESNSWVTAFSIANDKLPLFLQPVVGKIMNAGKYLNVLHQCGKYQDNDFYKKLTYSFHGDTYFAAISDALSYASKKLINFLINEKQLVAVLSSIRHYFLMDQGDFFVIFMDLAETTLSMPANDIDESKLESMLELAIRNSVVSSDPFNDNVRVVILDDDFATYQLCVLGFSPSIDSDNKLVSGIKSLGFTYNVEWPLSLIINLMTITKYQMLFRHLLYIKYCSRLLSKFWQNTLKSKANRNDSNKLKNSLMMILVNKMRHFLQNFEYFLHFDVIEPNWDSFISSIPNITTVDDLIRKHNDFLDKTVKDCMLTHPTLVEGFTQIIDLCYSFIRLQLSSSEQVDLEYLTRTNMNFTKYVCHFMDCLYQRQGLHYEQNMLMFAERLDFNHFYSRFKVQNYDEGLDNTASSSYSSGFRG